MRKCFWFLFLFSFTTRNKVRSTGDENGRNPPSFPNLPFISQLEISQAINTSESIVNFRINQFEPRIYNSGVEHEIGTAPYFMAISHRATANTQNISYISLLSEEVSKIIAQNLSLSREQISYALPNLDIRKLKLYLECPLSVDFPCQPRKYRAYNGYCNNVQHPKWGSAESRYLRYIMPSYADGVSAPRVGIDQKPLPSARRISLGIHKEADRPHSHLMALTAVWGEFISHDLVHTPQFAGFQGSPLKCCGVSFDNFHPECYPIRIPEGDPFYSKVQDKCQDYVRSSVAPRIGCTLGPREQVNQVSSFLDASHIYSTSKRALEKLRLFQGGLLRTQAGPGGELLPSDSSPRFCRENVLSFRCFKSGDDRVNEHLGLAALHTLWLREHNRIARSLLGMNPHWTDEIVFQEARRIVVAEIQHITYNEFLPVVLGESTLINYGLKSKSAGFFTGYDINTNAGIQNGVAAAALWFFASLMPKMMAFIDEEGRKIGERSIGDSFYAPFELYRNGALDQLLRGLLRGKAQSEDQFINEVITNRMFEDPKTGLGLDLAAQLIQQGRDHGIPGYVYYRELCGLGMAKDFDELNNTMTGELVGTLKRLYSSVQDVDLFTGGLSEIPQEGAVVGPTFACLLGLQFQKLKMGDRFWYENDLPPSAFTQEQLEELRKVSFARVICDNSRAVKELQPRVFLDRDPYLNAGMECEGDAVRRMDLRKWRNEQHQTILPSSKLRDAIQKARLDISEFHSHERDLLREKGSVDPHSPAGTASGFNKPKEQAVEIANTSFLLQFATTRFLKGLLPAQRGLFHSGELQDSENSGSGSREMREFLKALPSIDVSALTELPKNQKCGEHDLPCDHTSIFRSITGWCNNLRDPEKGKAFRAFKRLIPPEYHDGLQAPRIESITGDPLPSPRLVSTQVHDDISIPHQRYTLLLMQYAQLLDHDLTHTPMNRGFENTIIDCHSCDAKERVHPECWPIPIPIDDPHFSAINKTTNEPICLPFTRSLPGQLTLGVREQLNQVTAYVDASHTYGSDICEAKKLRSFSGGQMNVTSHPGGRIKPLLPQTPDHPECKAASGLCFEAGDLRASEQPALVAIHSIWLREHNRIASELEKRNPEWDDELLYNQARRILSSTTQHITYAEFLPRVLGWDTVHKYGLELIPEGYFNGYDPECDATIFNEFGAAAFRFGHSLLSPAFKRISPDLKVKEPSVQLRHTFFNPDILFRPGMIDELLFGLVNSPMENLDNFITEEVTNHLFEDRRVPLSGMDLAALNIARGRDHGIVGYNKYRAFCNLTVATSFEDLKKEIPERLVNKLSAIYPTVDDIDIFPGGLTESPVHGGVVGPTFACIIASQFKVLRHCDRYWYENSEPLTRFTAAQLSEIRKSSLSRLFCDNSDNIKTIQRSSLDVPEPFLNPRVPCESLPSINLDHWKERAECVMENQRWKVGKSQRVSPCVMCTCTREGPLCQSMKIDNCIRLSRSYPAQQILQDSVCKVQCAFSFRLFPPNQL